MALRKLLVFNTNGATQQLLATNTTPLATNVQYSATIIAMDANGNSATNNFGFNTVADQFALAGRGKLRRDRRWRHDEHRGHSSRHQRLSCRAGLSGCTTARFFRERFF